MDSLHGLLHSESVHLYYVYVLKHESGELDGVVKKRVGKAGRLNQVGRDVLRVNQGINADVIREVVLLVQDGFSNRVD